jgi:hypothetical protein
MSLTFFASLAVREQVKERRVGSAHRADAVFT